MSDAASRPAAEAEHSPAYVDIVLRGSVAVVRGVVERIEDRERILGALASLDSITGVEDDLRLRPAA